jgi:hypothetical protein
MSTIRDIGGSTLAVGLKPANERNAARTLKGQQILRQVVYPLKNLTKSLSRIVYPKGTTRFASKPFTIVPLGLVHLSQRLQQP